MTLTYQTQVNNHQVGFEQVRHSFYTSHRRHGQLHRINGPALLWQGQIPQWYYYGKWDERYDIIARNK
jgi:hypothetical protein